MQLNVAVDGPADAPAVVFLHGVTGGADTYAWLRPDHLGGRRLVRVDLRGHGTSPPAPGTYRIGPYTEDVVDVLAGLDGPPPVLVGHSLGGVVAWTVAQRRPDLIAGAFLEDPPLFFADPAEAPGNAALPRFVALRAALETWRADGLSAEAVAERIAGAPGGDQLDEGAALVRARNLLAMDPGVLDAAIDNTLLADADLRAPVGVPVLVLAGEEAAGAAFLARHVERLAASHPDVEVVVVPGASHLIHDETRSREAYVRALAGFVQRF